MIVIGQRPISSIRGPDDRIAQELQSGWERLTRDQYYEVFGDLRFGDWILFYDENDTAFHSAVYVTDDVVFTKNGPDSIRAWHLARFSDTAAFYYHREGVRMKLYRQKRS